VETLPPERLLALQKRALTLRRHIVDTVFAAGSGHPGGSLSIAEILVALYDEVMRHDASRPTWEDRDRLVLSKGHCCPGLYGILAMHGYFPVEDLQTLRKTGSHLQGHPHLGSTPGVEFNGGSEGQGLSGAVGMALAAKMDEKDHRIYCIIGDGECQAGMIWEAAGAASHFRLDNLTAVLDRNGLQIDGPTEEIMSIEPVAERWRAFGWNVVEVDGHEIPEVLDALALARGTKGRPTMIIAHTVKGKGVSYMEGTLSFHGKAPSKDELAKARTEFDLAERRLAASAAAAPRSDAEASRSGASEAGREYAAPERGTSEGSIRRVPGAGA